MTRYRFTAVQLLLLFYFVISLPGILAAGADSVRIMREEDYYRLILNNHPVAKQAATFSEAAKSEIRIARGLLDPKAEMNYGGKTLSGTDYYRSWDNCLKVPVWWGTDIKAGYELNQGQNTNPESMTPDAGLWYLGITVPLGQGLLIDERRNAIRQSQLLPAMAEAERVKLVNKLLFDATKEYWEWYYALERYRLLDEAHRLAAVRFEAIRLRVLQGDLPAIDTVEALIAVQDRELLRTQGKADYENAMLRASVYLWNSEQEPIELNGNVIPCFEKETYKPIAGDSLERLSYFSARSHPDLVKLDLKNTQLGIEKRYQQDKLKPKVSVQYNLLLKKLDDFSDAGNADLYTNNYKIGLSFAYPLFLRQERGKIQLTEIKMQQLDYERRQREREIANEMRSSHNNWIALEAQLVVIESQVANARLLRDGEQQRFDSGESSFFLVNTREMALINSQIRLAELQARYARNKAQLLWISGRPIAE